MYVRIADSIVQMDLLVPGTGTARCIRWGAPVAVEPAQLDLLLSPALEHQYPGVVRHEDGRLASHAPGLPHIPLVPGVDSFWMYSGGLQGHRGRDAWAPVLTLSRVLVDGVEVTGDASGSAVEVVSESDDLRLVVKVRAEHGVLLASAEVTNLSGDDYALDSLALTVPVESSHDELLDFAGRWTLERQPQRQPFTIGQHRRESRWGRPNHESVFLLAAGERGFDFERGRVQACHVAWAGNTQTFAEATVDGQRMVGGGELLLPGEVILASGQSYTSPELVLVHGDGLDELSSHLHEFVRSMPGRATLPRPVNYNCWEATMLGQTPEKLHALADRAAAAGAERFVVDDGWFRGRDDWGSGLGDWEVNRDKHPEGLEPLVEHVKALGMKFGLWFEPEMMSTGTRVATEHPEWLMTATGASIPDTPADMVMNLAAPGAEEYVRAAIAKQVREMGIDYIKWDHNRPLTSPGDQATGHAVVHENVLAVQRIQDALKAEFPGLEIESCAGGGGRVDLSTLSRTDRVWVSDSMDAVDRVGMQTWTSLIVPPEMMGAHVGSERASISQRKADLGYRAALCMFGHYGIEWDLTETTDEAMAELAQWTEFYKHHRDLIASGRMYRRLRADGVFLWGSVTDDRALYLIGTTRSNLAASPAGLRLPGLDAAASYEVAAVWPGELPGRLVAAPWFGAVGDGPVVVPGEVLSGVGLALPVLRSQESFFIEVRRVA